LKKKNGIEEVMQAYLLGPKHIPTNLIHL